MSNKGNESTSVRIEKLHLLSEHKRTFKRNEQPSYWGKRRYCMSRFSFVLQVLKWSVVCSVLVFRLVGMFLFSAWACDCFFREFRTTVTCTNFTLFPHPQLLAGTWLITTTATSVFLLWYVKGLAGCPSFKAILTHLLRRKYFYKISCILLLVAIYDVLTLTDKPEILRTFQYSTFMMEHITGVILMVTLNFVPQFVHRTDAQYNLKSVAYKVTLALYSLQGFGMYVLGTIIAVYKVLTISTCVVRPHYITNFNSSFDTFSKSNSLHQGEICHDSKSVVMLLLLMTSNGLRYLTGDFFMSKLFSEDIDILGGGHKPITSLELQVLHEASLAV